MASLRLPTLKQLERLRTGNDAFEWLASLEKELRAALDVLPASYVRDRRAITAKLERLQERREEYKAQIQV